MNIKIFLKSSIQIAVILLAGPCAIESEEMAMRIAEN
jgi:3-deoxy-D-manno-octulosonic acid (KDO) 8-phosphate synthase